MFKQALMIAVLCLHVPAYSYPARAWAAVGVEGLAPYFFDCSDPCLRVEITHVRDRPIVERFLVAIADGSVAGEGFRQTGSGFSDIDTGVRLRYELTRKFSPYIGWAYNGKYGGSAICTRQSGEPTSNSSFVFGVRVWY